MKTRGFEPEKCPIDAGEPKAETCWNPDILHRFLQEGKHVVMTRCLEKVQIHGPLVFGVQPFR